MVESMEVDDVAEQMDTDLRTTEIDDVVELMDIDVELCKATINQSDSDAWWSARLGRITASNFGRVMSARNTLSLERLSKDIKSPRDISAFVPPACRVGMLEEGNAKKAYIDYQRVALGQNVTIKDVGLCVPNDCPFIGASPDGVVLNADGSLRCLLEVKCIYDNGPLPSCITDIAKKRGSSFFCKIGPNGDLHLKRNHRYYYQCLGEMATTGLHALDFVVYHPRTLEIRVESISFVASDWERVKAKLVNFAANYMVK